MKKITTLALTTLTLLFFTFNFTSAQTLSAEKAYEDYQFSLQTYNNSKSDYEDARDFYLKNQTLTLKEDARKKTLKMLKDRDQLEIVYMTALRSKINESKGLTSDERNTIFGTIDNEIAWYKEHSQNYKDGEALEDLFNKSSESESRYKTDTLPAVYESLFLITLGDQVGIRNENEGEYGGLKTLVSNGVNNGKLDMNPFSRWFTDIDSVITQLKANEDKARNQIKAVRTQAYSASSAYSSSVKTLSDSQSLLLQLNNFLIEVLTSIRNQQ